MEKTKQQLEKHFNFAHRSSQSLRRVLRKLASKKEVLDREELEVYHDSIIKRFELAYETFWKYLKTYLVSHYGVDAAAPREVFRTCLRLKVVNEQEAQKLINMINARNLTTHVYDQETAHEMIMKVVPEYLELIQSVLEKAQGRSS